MAPGLRFGDVLAAGVASIPECLRKTSPLAATQLLVVLFRLPPANWQQQLLTPCMAELTCEQLALRYTRGLAKPMKLWATVQCIRVQESPLAPLPPIGAAWALLANTWEEKNIMQVPRLLL